MRYHAVVGGEEHVIDITSRGGGKYRVAIGERILEVDAVHLQGFADGSRRLNLTVGSAFDVSLTLAIATVEASVNVTGEPPLVEAARTQIAGCCGNV